MNKSAYNHPAIWVMIIFYQILGIVWYLPSLFLHPWLSGQGKTVEQLNPSDPTPIVWAVITTIIAGYTISWLIQKLGINTFQAGIKFGLILFFGLLLFALGPHYKFLQLPDSVLLIDLGPLFIWTLLTTGLLAKFNKRAKSK